MSDLACAIRITEEVKRIVSASRQVNLVAINALITARQAGARSRGFAVVSRELRSLATGLESAMADLDAVISSLANGMAESLKSGRLLAYIQATVVLSEEPHRSLRSALEALTRKHAALNGAVAADWLRLERSTRQAIRVTGMGNALSRSAKIEAAYGGDMIRVLTQVAEHVEASLHEIVTRLAGIRVLIDEYHRGRR